MQATASKILPAGNYIVGDPCYSISDEDWMPLLTEQGIERTPTPWIMEGEIISPRTGQPVTFTASMTAFGDGVYEDQDGRRYPVDAGMIGVVPEHLADVTYEDGTHLIEFDEPFTVAYDEGKITIGHIVIDTGDEPEWDEIIEDEMEDDQ